MKNLPLKAVLAATILAIPAAPLVAREHPRDLERRHEERYDRYDRHDRYRRDGRDESFRDRIGLNDRQYDRFISLREEYARNSRHEYRLLVKLRQERLDELHRRRPDHRRIARLERRIRQQSRKLDRLRADYLGRCRDVCDHRQRERFDTFIRFNSPELAVMLRF